MATTTFYDKFIENLGLKLIDLRNDSIKVMLVSNSYTFDSSHEDLSDITGELANGSGYTTGGEELDNQTWVETAGVTKFDADDIVWSASGGMIGPAIGAIIYDDTSDDDLLIAYMDFGGEEDAGDGTDFKITFNANGIFSVTSA